LLGYSAKMRIAGLSLRVANSLRFDHWSLDK
jgi:hypothetical protein